MSSFHEQKTDGISVDVLDTDISVTAFRDADDMKKGKVLVSSDSVNGNKYIFNEGVTDHIKIKTIDTTHFVVAYSDESNSYYGTIVIGTVTGTVISYGSKYIFNKGMTEGIDIEFLDSIHFIITYRDNEEEGHGVAMVGTISGTTISFGNKYVFSEEISKKTSTSKIDSTHFVVGYTDFSNKSYGTVNIGTISGTTISFGDKYVFNENGSWEVGVAILDTTHLVIGYIFDNNAHIGATVVGVIDGTTISFGDKNIFNKGFVNYLVIIAIDTEYFVVLYDDATYSGRATYRRGLISGNAITYDSVIPTGCLEIYALDAALCSSSDPVKMMVGTGTWRRNFVYSTGESATLPTNNAKLSTEYTQQFKINVVNDDGYCAYIETSSNYALHLFTDYIFDNFISLKCVCQSSVAPSTSTIYLQVYNKTTTTWETLKTNTTANADTNFTFEVAFTDSELDTYKNGDNSISCRIYQYSDDAIILRIGQWQPILREREWGSKIKQENEWKLKTKND